MPERLLYSEIVQRFPDEYVLLGNYITDDQSRPIEGDLLYHSKSRADFDSKYHELRPQRAALLFTGKPRKDLIVIL